MGLKLNQILVSSGLYFIISSFLGLINSSFNSLFALAFPVFLIFIISLTLLKQLSWVRSLTKKFPNIFLLLNVLGIYTVVYFIINIIGIVLQYMNEQGLLTSVYSIYEEWGEPAGAVIDILFFAVFIVALFIILVRSLKKSG